jgi:hypothetical protein
MLGPVIEVDTASPVDVAALAARVIAAIDSSQAPSDGSGVA